MKQVNRRQLQRMSTKEIKEALPFDLVSDGEVIAYVNVAGEVGRGRPNVNVAGEAGRGRPNVNVAAGGKVGYLPSPKKEADSIGLPLSKKSQAIGRMGR